MRANRIIYLTVDYISNQGLYISVFILYNYMENINSRNSSLIIHQIISSYFIKVSAVSYPIHLVSPSIV